MAEEAGRRAQEQVARRAEPARSGEAARDDVAGDASDGAPLIGVGPLDSRADHDLTAALLLRDSVLDRVFHERLEQQGRQANIPKPRWYG